MMKKLYLILAIYFALSTIWSLIFDESETDKFLMIEMNIWYVRLIWGAGAAFFFLAYFKSNTVKK